MASEEGEAKKLIDVKIRSMRAEDVEQILAIDRKISGRDRAATFHRRVDAYLATDPLVCRVAEVDGKVVGFMLGDIKGWEYGAPEAGWIEVMAVDTEFQGNGIGRRLAEALFDHFQRTGMKRVYTLVDWADGPLLSYFKSLGFRRSDLINLERDL